MKINIGIFNKLGEGKNESDFQGVYQRTPRGISDAERRRRENLRSF